MCQPPTLAFLLGVDVGVFGGPMTSIAGEEIGNGEGISLSMIAVVLVEDGF